MLESIFGGKLDTKFDRRDCPVVTYIFKKNATKVNANSLSIFYDKFSTRYTNITKKTNYGIPKWLKSKLEPLRIKAPIILDIGCANGVSATWIREVGLSPNIFGIDLSEQMIAECRKRKEFLGCIKWDLENGLPVNDDRFFDVVLALGVFEFVKNQKKALQDIKNTLNFNGKLYLTLEFNKNGYEVSCDSQLNITRYLHDIDSFKALVISVGGFKINSVEKIFAYHSIAYKKDVYYLACELERVD